MKYDFAEYEKKLKKHLDKYRYQHTLGVRYTAAALAMAHGMNLEQAQLAGLLHDCAKCIPNKKKLKLCSKHEIEISEVERRNLFLLHAKLGVYIAREKYQVKDPEVLSAIRWHTTGKPDMSDLEKLVYIADYIEPRRNKMPNLNQVRQLAFQSLDECMYVILKGSMSYLGKNEQAMDSATESAFHFYEAIHMQGNKKEENKREQ